MSNIVAKETNKKPKQKRQSIDAVVLMQHEKKNFKFAGLFRRMDDVLTAKAIEKIENQKEKTAEAIKDEVKKEKSRIRRIRNSVMSAIMNEGDETTHEPYKAEIKIVYGDIVENRHTEELEALHSKMVNDFKATTVKSKFTKEAAENLKELF